jgi:large subunit ribosomal protein L20
MARVKRGPHRKNRRKGVLKEASGYFGMKSTSYRIAKQAVDKSGVYAYVGRKQKKRDMRSLWIVRINAAARLHGISYNRLIEGLKKTGSEINRKMLAELAVRDAAAFAELAQAARSALGAEATAGGAPSGG